jgi:hypothetical protein
MKLRKIAGIPKMSKAFFTLKILFKIKMRG